MRSVSFICQAGVKPALCHRHQWCLTNVDGPAVKVAGGRERLQKPGCAEVPFHHRLRLGFWWMRTVWGILSSELESLFFCLVFCNVQNIIVMLILPAVFIVSMLISESLESWWGVFFDVPVDLLFQRLCQGCVKVRDVLPPGIYCFTISSVHNSRDGARGDYGGETQKAACCIDCVWVVNRGPLGSMFRVIRWSCGQRVACSTSHLLHADLLVWFQSDKADCFSFKWQRKSDISEMVVCAVLLNLGGGGFLVIFCVHADSLPAELLTHLSCN